MVQDLGVERLYEMDGQIGVIPARRLGCERAYRTDPQAQVAFHVGNRQIGFNRAAAAG
ncbi:hypothetical protein EDF56_105179 [Novosphingobium sp. PhB165]|nr:hypothetical protein EDF56_105179 [Novosphingobium sp. PhB165]